MKNIVRIRKPVVAGQFYAGDKKGLVQQIERSFKSEFGPGKLPKIGNGKRITAALVPHAGYFFSGSCAAHSYHEVAGAEKPDVFVVMGPNHSGLGQTSTSLEDWETPLGIAKVDKEFAKALDIEINTSSMKAEHSIEVQLPFLQYIYGDRFRFVPICVTKGAGIADKIKSAVDETEKTVTLVTSSDMTHYGMGYGYMPFLDDVKENMYKLDKKALELVEKLDTRGFKEYLEQTSATVCGASPVVIMMEYCRMLGATTVKLLKYYTSGDIINDYSSAVGYASLVILK